MGDGYDGKTSRIARDPRSLPAIAELAERRQWVCWRLEERHGGGKPTKVPYQIDGRKASSTNPSTWNDFEACWRAAFTDGQFDGVGFVFAHGDGYVGVDLDHVRVGDVWADWSVAVVRFSRTYVEVSQSGEGLHLILRGDDLPKGLKIAKAGGASIEVYPHGRFFALTGDVFEHRTLKHDASRIGDVDVEFLLDHPLFQGEGQVAGTGATKGNGDARPHAGGSNETHPDAANLIVDSSRSFSHSKMTKLFKIEPKLKWRYEKTEAPQNDSTRSSYLFSIISLAIATGQSAQDSVDLAIEWCKSQDYLDLINDYQIKRCVSKKLFDKDAKKKVDVKPSEAAEQLDDMNLLDTDEEDVFGVVSARLGGRVTAFYKIGKPSAEPDYAIEINGQRVRLGPSAVLMDPKTIWTILADVADLIIDMIPRQKWFAILTLLKRVQTVEDEDSDFGAETIVDHVHRIVNGANRGEDLLEGLQDGKPIQLDDGRRGVSVQALVRKLRVDGHRMTESVMREKLKSLGWARKTLSYKDKHGNTTSRSYYLEPPR